MLTSEIVHEYRKVYGESIDSILLLDAGQYKDSIGRSYYAIFSAVRAVLAENKVDFSKHAGAYHIFRRNM